MSVWDGVVVSALDKAFEKTQEKGQQENEGDGLEAEDEPMDTAET